MKISLGYPSPEEEQAILRSRRERKKDPFELKAVIDAGTLLAMRAGVEEVYLDPDLEKYIVQLVSKTRSHRNVAVGSSPRGALALLKLSRARAALQGRDYVLPDDIKHFAQAALAHRLILEPDLWTVKRAAGDLIQEIVNVLPVPVFKR
jgi:MoxR-like ATPase